MKRLLLILILTFSFQTLAKADDIRDFQIEGMSIGDSFLDCLKKHNFSIDKFKNNKSRFYYPNSKKFYGLKFLRGTGKYENFGFLFKENDDRYIIYNVSGRQTFPNALSECKKEKNKIVNEFKSLVKDAEMINHTYNYTRDDGKSVSYITDFSFKDGAAIRVYCDNWSSVTEKKMKWIDSLSVTLSSSEALNWLTNEARK